MKPLVRNLLALAGFLLVFPWFVSRKFRVVGRVLIHARPSTVFPLIDDLRHWPRWTAWAQREEIHFSYEGPPTGTGAVQRWESARMDGVMRVTQSHENERVAYDLSLNSGRWHLEGIFSLEPVGEYTRVTWICKWDAGSNPYRAYLNLFIKACLGRDFAASLHNLRGLAEQSSA
jgi:hypothetical protein